MNIKKKKVETPLEDLCKDKNGPIESCFKNYMEYCRSLEFTQDPDYKKMIKLFEDCMAEKGFDPKVFDYTWKEDRLKRDKKALKEEMMRALTKKKPA